MSKRVRKWIKVISLIIMGLIATFTLLSYRHPLPEPFPNGVSPRVVSSQNTVLRSFPDAMGVYRYHIDLEDVTDFYLKSLLNYEDRWFYYHYGVNPFSLIRAAFQWAKSGRVISGGSTITMQVARLIVPHPRSIMGKLTQIFRAIQLESQYSKNEILTLYLNLAPFGGNIEGVEAAANKYFSKHASELTYNEATTLVVLPQKPSAYRPDKHPELALKMRNKVLYRSYQAQLIDNKQYTMLVSEPLNQRIEQKKVYAPLLSRKLVTQLPELAVIETEIDAQLQWKIQQLLLRQSAQLPAKSSSAVLVLRNSDAAVIGYRGSVDFNNLSRFSYIDMVHAVRSPGSTLKPFIYAMALDKGLIHSESLLSDIPTSFSGYKPTNLNGVFHGPASVSQALKLSLNIPAVQVLNKLGTDTFLKKIRETGVLFTNDDANLTIALGGVGTNLWSLATLYRSLATQGRVKQPYLLSNRQLKASSYHGHSATDSKDVPFLSKESSWIIFKTLSAISAPDRVVPSSRREIAWKTGTSYGYRDFWSVGVSKDYTVAVWVGRPDATPIVGYLGATQASPVMFDIFDLLPRDKSKVDKPETVEEIQICWPGGLQKKFTLDDKCHASRQAYSINGIAPPTMDSFGQFVMGSERPSQLALWMQTNKKSIDKLENTPIKIRNIRTGQHFFKQEVDSIPLHSNKPKERIAWYINGRIQLDGVLPLSELQGETKISVCMKMACDSVKIYVH